jgi:CRISPR-associated protein Csm4
LKSLFGTPWQADTIIGHLAWLVAYQEGSSGVKDLLSHFLEGNPPFVFSDGFPAGLLPRPIGLWRPQAPKDLASYADEKIKRKSEFVSLAQFEALRRGKEIEIEPIASPWIELETLHSTISRQTGTTSGEAGNLFSTESWTIKQDLRANNYPSLSIFVYCFDEWVERIERWFRDLSLVGYGRDKSVGSGQFEFAGVQPWDGFGEFDGANGFVSLSSYAPGINDPTEGKWLLNVKYGKLGENAGSGNPFKRPLLQVKPGATFFTGEKPKSFYGGVVKGLAPSFADSIQICYCLAVPCRLKKHEFGV